jgi:copper chaperone CopZ
MSCGGCVASVEKALAAVPGVEKVEVRLAEKRALVWVREVPRERLVNAVNNAGYDAA